MRRGGPHARAEATRTAGTWSGPQRPPSPASSSDGFEVIAGTPGTASAASALLRAGVICAVPGSLKAAPRFALGRDLSGWQ